MAVDQDAELAGDLLEDFAGQCKIFAACIDRGTPVTPAALEIFDGSWLLMRVTIEGLGKEGRDNGKRAFIDLSAAVIAHLKQLRAKVVADS